MIETISVEAVGNAFLLADQRQSGEQDWSAAAQEVCWGVNRNRAECDGLLVVTSANPLRVRMFNPDGTEDFCGNGLLCTATYAWQTGIVRETDFTIEHGGRSIAARLDVSGDTVERCRVALPPPSFRPGSIPVLSEQRADERFHLELPDVPYVLWPVSTGTAHAIIYCAKPPEDDEFEQWSPRIEHHPVFPERTTVDWVTPVSDDRARVRVWERGVGETLGCGTGAAAVAATSFGMLHCRSLDVESKGGVLHVEWPGHGPISIAGLATVRGPVGTSVPSENPARR